MRARRQGRRRAIPRSRTAARHRGDGAGTKNRSARTAGFDSPHQRPGTAWPKPSASPAPATTAAILPRPLPACGLETTASAPKTSKSPPALASAKQPSGRCGTYWQETPSSPDEKRRPETNHRPDLTNGCTLSLGSNARKTALLKAFDRLPATFRMAGNE